MSSYDAVKLKAVRPLYDHVIVSDMAFKERLTNHGILLINDDAKSSGIRPRWGKVYAIGPEQKDVQVGQWIMVAHGRWTRGIKVELPDGEQTLRRVDVNDIMLVSDEEPNDETLGQYDDGR